MVVAAIGVAAMSADARSQLRKYRNQPVMAPRTNPQRDREDDEEHDPCSQFDARCLEHRKARRRRA